MSAANALGQNAEQRLESVWRRAEQNGASLVDKGENGTARFELRRLGWVRTDLSLDAAEHWIRLLERAPVGRHQQSAPSAPGADFLRLLHDIGSLRATVTEARVALKDASASDIAERAAAHLKAKGIAVSLEDVLREVATQQRGATA